MSDREQGHAETTVRAHVERKTNDLCTARVVVVEGADKGASLIVRPDSPGAVLVGSGPACDLVLSDPTVSRRHVSRK